MPSEFSPRWSELLSSAVSRPGLLLEAYSRFHGYSLGNQLAAMFQCQLRNLPPGPIATLQKWNALGRSVRKGERAIVLCMPVTVRVREDASSPTPPGPPRLKTVFAWKPRWFVLGQTDGPNLPAAVPIPTWDEARALGSIGVRRVPFAHPDGNVQGYARDRTVAVSPIAALPAKTLFHELGHILLGHTTEPGTDQPDLPKSLVEAEAEAVALLCLEALELPGADYARGYIQSWYGSGQPLPDGSAARIFKAADTILRAGREDATTVAVPERQAA